MGIPVVRVFGEPSTQPEFDEFDGSAVEDGKLEGKVPDRSPAEDGGDEGSEQNEVSGSKPRKKPKPPTVDEYQWQWKVGHLAHALHRGALTRCHNLSLRLPFTCGRKRLEIRSWAACAPSAPPYGYPTMTG